MYLHNFLPKKVPLDTAFVLSMPQNRRARTQHIAVLVKYNAINGDIGENSYFSPKSGGLLSVNYTKKSQKSIDNL